MNEEDELEKKIKEIQMEISGLKTKEIFILREIARKKGIIARNLSDLGEFEEIKPGEKHPNPLLLPKKIKMAMIPGTDIFKRNPEKVTYFCKRGCGWVKGFPKEKWYNDLGLLSGSAGWVYLCHICGEPLAREKFIIS